MTDPDRAATRRDITAALEAAFERRHEVLDAIVEAEDRSAAVSAIANLLSVPTIGAEAVLGMSFDRLTVSARRANAAELEDLNSKLTFTQTERPAATAETLTLRPFDDSDADLFTARTSDVGAAGDGSGTPASGIDDEIAAARSRMKAEEAVWLVAVEGDDKVGIVFGEIPEIATHRHVLIINVEHGIPLTWSGRCQPLFQQTAFFNSLCDNGRKIHRVGFIDGTAVEFINFWQRIQMRPFLHVRQPLAADKTVPFCEMHDHLRD